MYKGFKFKTSKNELECDLRFGGKKEYDRLEDIGKKEIIDKHESEISGSLKEFVSNGAIDASKLQDAWFPQIKAHVFISHSHKDEPIALFLAGWLHENFKLTSFIDSCVWRYMNDLLWEIDCKYCRNGAEHFFDYKKRNLSTSHVHMMLSTALTMMIDQTECLLFLNTPNSITPDSVFEQTTSPWIYHELATSRMLRVNFPERIKRIQDEDCTKMQKDFSDTEQISRFNYTVNTDHLVEINRKDLSEWSRIEASGGIIIQELIQKRPPCNGQPEMRIFKNKKKHAFDVLYEDVIKKQASS